MPEITGHCLCGAVRFRVRGLAKRAGHCHCESCRRATSSPVTTFFTAARANTDLDGDSLRFFASSPGVERGFCGTCGSPMSYATDARPAEIDLYVASLDAGLSVPIEEHDHWGERVGWLTIIDDLPKREKDA